MLPVLSRVEMRGEPGDVDVFGNPNELAEIPDNSPEQVWAATMARVFAVQEYSAKFNAAFPGVPASFFSSFKYAANAIAAFQLQELTRTKSPFDRYLARENSALTDEEKRGALLFFGKGRCSACHSGALLGGQQFANIGVPQIGPGVGAAAPLDVGRAEHLSDVPGVASFARFTFRAPALRNVDLTAPYMHNGAFRTLETVVRHYTNPDSSLRNYDVAQLDAAVRPLYRGDAATQDAVLSNLDARLGSSATGDRIQLTETERAQIVLFLKALTDPAARDLSHVVPSAVPSGLPIR
jgi:cytochrome c peroxidase